MVKIVFEEENQRSAAYDEEKEVGESSFSDARSFWIIDHTSVDDNYSGQGIAKKLVEEIVNQARSRNMKILPLCPYAKKEFEKRSEYADVLKK